MLKVIKTIVLNFHNITFTTNNNEVIMFNIGEDSYIYYKKEQRLQVFTDKHVSTALVLHTDEATEYTADNAGMFKSMWSKMATMLSNK